MIRSNSFFWAKHSLTMKLLATPIFETSHPSINVTQMALDACRNAFENSTRCGVCREPFSCDSGTPKTPTILHCGHSPCAACTQGNIENGILSARGKLRCGVCQETTCVCSEFPKENKLLIAQLEKERAAQLVVQLFGIRHESPGVLFCENCAFVLNLCFATYVIRKHILPPIGL